MESLGFPIVAFFNFAVLFANASLIYRLSSTASQAKAVMALIEVTAVLITHHNSAVLMRAKLQT